MNEELEQGTFSCTESAFGDRPLKQPLCSRWQQITSLPRLLLAPTLWSPLVYPRGLAVQVTPPSSGASPNQRHLDATPASTSGIWTTSADRRVTENGFYLPASCAATRAPRLHAALQLESQLRLETTSPSRSGAWEPVGHSGAQVAKYTIGLALGSEIGS